MKRFITEYAHYAIEHNHACYFRHEITRKNVVLADEKIRAAIKGNDRGLITIKETMRIITDNTF